MKEFNCSHCELKFESKVALSQHVRENHFKNQVSQTKEENMITTCEYPCLATTVIMLSQALKIS